MNVRVEDILKIKTGKAQSFVCESPLSARSGQSLVSYVKKYRKPMGVKDYETAVNENVLTVMAIGE